MSLRFLDGFDHYDTARILQKWTQMGPNGGVQNSIVAPGRFAYGGCLQMNGVICGVSRAIQNGLQTWVIGGAFSLAAAPNVNGVPLLWVSDTTSGFPGQVGLIVDSVGRIQVWRGDFTNGGKTLMAQSQPNVFSFASVWQYVEFKVTIAGGVGGSYAVRLNGFPIPSLPDAAGVNTQSTANAFGDSFWVLGVPGGQQGTNAGVTQADDVYCCDTAGAVNNDFLGPLRVQALLPNADGDLSQWTPNPVGNHFANVNQNPPDDDATYNSSLTPGQIDTFFYAGLVGAPTLVKGVQLVMDARKDDASGREIAGVIRGAAVNHPGATQPIADNYRFYMDQRDQNPVTAANWAVADFVPGTFQAGYEEIA